MPCRGVVAVPCSSSMGRSMGRVDSMAARTFPRISTTNEALSSEVYVAPSCIKPFDSRLRYVIISMRTRAG